MGELIGFCLSKAVPRICDKNYRHHELSLRVHQLLEGLFSRGDRQPSPHQHAVDVEEEPEARLGLQDEGKKKIQNLWLTVAVKHDP